MKAILSDWTLGTVFGIGLGMAVAPVLGEYVHGAVIIMIGTATYIVAACARVLMRRYATNAQQ